MLVLALFTLLGSSPRASLEQMLESRDPENALQIIQSENRRELWPQVLSQGITRESRGEFGLSLIVGALRLGGHEAGHRLLSEAHQQTWTRGESRTACRDRLFEMLAAAEQLHLLEAHERLDCMLTYDIGWDAATLAGPEDISVGPTMRFIDQHQDVFVGWSLQHIHEGHPFAAKLLQRYPQAEAAEPIRTMLLAQRFEAATGPHGAFDRERYPTLSLWLRAYRSACGNAPRFCARLSKQEITALSRAWQQGEDDRGALLLQLAPKAGVDTMVGLYAQRPAAVCARLTDPRLPMPSRKALKRALPEPREQKQDRVTWDVISQSNPSQRCVGYLDAQGEPEAFALVGTAHSVGR